MDLPAQRYRSLSVLVVAVLVQLLLLGYQVKTQQDVRLIRVWAVGAMSPVARLVEGMRTSVSSVLGHYVFLIGVRDENQKLKEELDQLKLEAQYLRSELATAERASALSLFRERLPSKTVAARIIGAGTGSDSRVVFIDRGSSSGVTAGMAVITPDGIVGKIEAAYSSASQAVLINDADFATGVISQKNHVQGTLKGQGQKLCIVDYVHNEEELEVGEWFFTSGDDRVFPRGLPVGRVVTVRRGTTLKEIHVAPSGLEGGLEEVLVVIEGVHQTVPGGDDAEQRPYLLPPPPARSGDSPVEAPDVSAPALSTDADRLIDTYRQIGEEQNHVFGRGRPGSAPPNFNPDPAPSPAPVPEQ